MLSTRQSAAPEAASIYTTHLAMKALILVKGVRLGHVFLRLLCLLSSILLHKESASFLTRQVEVSGVYWVFVSAAFLVTQLALTARLNRELAISAVAKIQCRGGSGITNASSQASRS